MPGSGVRTCVGGKHRYGEAEAHSGPSIKFNSSLYLVLNSIAITLNGDKVATTSEKGINIRIFNAATGDLLQEVRRGNEYGMIYSLAFSRAGNWLCCTSDSNIVHVFAILPSPETVSFLPPSVNAGTLIPMKILVEGGESLHQPKVTLLFSTPTHASL